MCKKTNVHEINKYEADEIIRVRKPLGVFKLIYEDKCYVLDNSKGEAILKEIY